jgi:NitT/TauT family transport system substrate-binding protein
MSSRAKFLTALAAVPLAASVPRTVAAQGSGVLRVAATANDTYAEAYYADALGAFKKAGLDVELQTFTAGAPVSAAVAGGAADIGIAGAPTIAAASLHGIPFQYIASGGIYTTDHPTTGIVVATDGPIKSARDFEGQNVAVGAIKDGNWLAAVAWIDEHGGDATKVKFVELPFAEMGPAIKRGTVVGGTLPEPSQTRAMKTGGLRMFAHHFDAYGKRTMIGGWFARADWIAANIATARRYASVIYQIAKWANRNPGESAAILATVSKIDDETTRTMIRCQYGESLNAALVQSQIDLAVKYKVLDRAVAASDILAKI